MKYVDAREKVESKTWADLELRPTGKVLTKEQYEYVLYYGKNTSIAVDDRYIKTFEEERGKYLHLGSWFGGASFYFYFSDKPEGADGTMICDKSGRCAGYERYYKEFSYGKFGKIEFE